MYLWLNIIKGTMVDFIFYYMGMPSNMQMYNLERDILFQ